MLRRVNQLHVLAKGQFPVLVRILGCFVLLHLNKDGKIQRCFGLKLGCLDVIVIGVWMIWRASRIPTI